MHTTNLSGKRPNPDRLTNRGWARFGYMEVAEGDVITAPATNESMWKLERLAKLDGGKLGYRLNANGEVAMLALNPGPARQLPLLRAA